VSSETGPLDDAALVCPEGAERALLMTLDVITPIVDDPVAFGRIAAANSMSDVYAMGGSPELALSFVGIPDALGLDVLGQILLGMTEAASAAGCAIVGGHTIRDTEPKAGLSVVGSVRRDRAWTHTRAKAGQRLVLTKAVGTGVVAQALRSDRAEPESIAAATRSMELSNRAACEAGLRHAVTAATDVTGFGLLGHLRHLLDASNLGAVIQSSRVPLLLGALAAAAAGLVPGGSRRNQRYVADRLRGAERIDPDLLTLLCDAQTSGGLLLCVPAEQAAALVSEIGPPCAIIGELTEAEPGSLRLEA
jgi:selenide, water dikinase